jgi:hypothetical protein
MNQTKNNNNSSYFQFIILWIVIIVAGQSKSLLFVPILIGVIIIWYNKFVNDPVWAFMFALTIFYNIGNYLTKKSFGLFNVFQVRDLFLILAFLAGTHVYLKKLPRVWSSNIGKNIVVLLMLFTFYQIFISAFLLHEQSVKSLVKEIVAQRWRFFGVFIIFPAYKIFLYDPKLVVNIIVRFTIFILGIYFFSLFSGINLIDISISERFSGTGMIRKGIRNYGFMQNTIIFMVVVIWLRKFEGKRMFLVAGIGMLITTLLTLTRYTNFTTFTSIIISVIMISFLGYKLKVGHLYTKLIGVIIVMITIMVLFFPNLITNLYETYYFTWLEITGEVAKGTTQSRSEIEYVNVMPVIEKNPFFGVGFTDYMLGREEGGDDFGFSDIPLFANIAIYGFFGLALYYSVYFLVLKLIFQFLKTVRRYGIYYFNSYSMLLFITYSVSIINTIIFKTFNISSDLSLRSGRIYHGIMLAIILSSVTKYQFELTKELNRKSKNNMFNV